MDSVSIEVPRDIIESAQLTVQEIKLEIAVLLYAQRRLPIGKACELAGVTLPEFRKTLGSRRIPAHYDPEDLEDDVETLRRLGRL